MSDDILIRTAEPNDFKFLPHIENEAANLFRSFVAVFDDSLPPAPESYYHSLPQCAEVFIATTQNNNIVGFVVVKTLDSQAYIAEIDVLPDYGHKGIGRKLLERAILWAQNHSYDYITLTTFKNIPFNAPFYRKLGFCEFTPDEKSSDLKKVIQNETEIFGDHLKENPRIAMKLNLRNNP
ncbi:MAG: GNAT family N-acetyltransferase [Alphaproteobacteria bacterium]